MSLAVFFEKKCVDALKENIALVLKKLSNPKDLFNVEISGGLVDAAKDGLGSLAQYSEEYIKSNSDKIALGLVQAVGAEDFVRQATNTVYNMFAVGFLTYNTFALYMMKVLARRIVSQIDSKRAIINKVRSRLIELHNVLKSLSLGDPVYQEYLEKLREAYNLLVSAEREVRVVKSTIAGSGIYLSQRYTKAQENVKKAQALIREPVSGGVPHFSSTDIMSSMGIPSKREQFDNMLLVPRISWNIIKDMKEYSIVVASINGLIATYVAGVEVISTALTDNLKRYASQLLDQVIVRIKAVKEDIYEVTRGKTEKRINPITGVSDSFSVPPNPVRVSSSAVKWAIDLSMVISNMKLLPDKALSSPLIAAGRADIQAYMASVNALKGMDNMGTGVARLDAKDAQENITGLEQQLLTLMLQANAAVATAQVGPATLSLAQSMVARMDLTISRDDSIKSALQKFIDYELEGEEQLERLMNGINDLLEKAGLDRAVTLLNEGKLEEFFKMSPKAATFVGAGLQAVALLKECFDTVEEQQEITKVQRELEREQDLVNIKVSFDFDIAILKNLDLCLRVRGLSANFNLKEFLCQIAQEAGVGKIFSALNSVVSF
jgi:hypothetical protein